VQSQVPAAPVGGRRVRPDQSSEQVYSRAADRKQISQPGRFAAPDEAAMGVWVKSEGSL